MSTFLVYSLIMSEEQAIANATERSILETPFSTKPLIQLANKPGPSTFKIVHPITMLRPMASTIPTTRPTTNGVTVSRYIPNMAYPHQVYSGGCGVSPMQ